MKQIPQQQFLMLNCCSVPKPQDFALCPRRRTSSALVVFICAELLRKRDSRQGRTLDNKLKKGASLQEGGGRHFTSVSTAELFKEVCRAARRCKCRLLLSEHLFGPKKKGQTFLTPLFILRWWSGPATTGYFLPFLPG